MSGLAIDNFTFISLEKFIEINNKPKTHVTDEQIEDIQAAVERRDTGAECFVCGCSPIWAVGSALCGTDMCFTCITGESDAANDYEVI